jgi:hypothetical protein
MGRGGDCRIVLREPAPQLADERIEVNGPDVFVAEDDPVTGRSQAGHGGQGQVGEDTALVEAREDTVEGPEGLGILRGDQVDFQQSPPLVFLLLVDRWYPGQLT